MTREELVAKHYKRLKESARKLPTKALVSFVEQTEAVMASTDEMQSLIKKLNLIPGAEEITNKSSDFVEFMKIARLALHEALAERGHTTTSK